jgi:hypothetical protein
MRHASTARPDNAAPADACGKVTALPGRLAALVSRLQADRNERSGEQRKWGMQ